MENSAKVKQNQHFVKTVWQFLQKLKAQLTYSPDIHSYVFTQEN